MQWGIIHWRADCIFVLCILYVLYSLYFVLLSLRSFVQHFNFFEVFLLSQNNKQKRSFCFAVCYCAHVELVCVIGSLILEACMSPAVCVHIRTAVWTNLTWLTEPIRFYHISCPQGPRSPSSEHQFVSVFPNENVLTDSLHQRTG